MGCYSEIGVIILLYFVVVVLNIVKTPKQMNCFGVLQRFQPEFFMIIKKKNICYFLMGYKTHQFFAIKLQNPNH